MKVSLPSLDQGWGDGYEEALSKLLINYYYYYYYYYLLFIWHNKKYTKYRKNKTKQQGQ